MDFYQRLADYIYSTFPDKAQDLKPDDILARIRGEAARAQSYGFESERDVVRFVDLYWRIDPAFDDHDDYPWARDILRNGDIPADQKIALLRDAYAMHRAQMLALKEAS